MPHQGRVRSQMTNAKCRFSTVCQLLRGFLCVFLLLLLFKIKIESNVCEYEEDRVKHFLARLFIGTCRTLS